MEVVVPINNLAVLVAAISSMFTGFVWYGPLFGKMWMKESGISMDKMTQEKKKGMMKSYGLMFLGSLLMSYLFAHLLVFANSYLKVSGITAGLMGAFWNWLGFIVPVTLSSVLWEGKTVRLWLINIGYYLVTLMVMGVILSVWV